MLRLMRANLGRLRRDRAFWVAVGGMVCYALLICYVAFYQKFISGNGSQIVFDELLFSAYGIKGYITVPAFLLAVFSSLFIGTEFSDGTIRNKIVVGGTRPSIYLSCFLTCGAVGLFMNLIYFLLVCAIGIPLVGPPTLPASVLVPWLAAGTLSVLSYAALFTLLSMLVQNKTTVAIASLLTLFAAILLMTYLMSRLNEPQMMAMYDLVDGAMATTGTMPNPNYLSPGPRAAAEFFIDLAPTGQSLQISSLSAFRPLRMVICSLGVVAVSCLAGIACFRRRDLK